MLKFGIKIISSLIQVVFQKDEENSSLSMTVFDQFSCQERHKEENKIFETIIIIIF